MNQPLSVRLPEHIRVADIDEKAKALGMSRAGFVINAIETMLGLDVEFYQEMERYSKGLRVPVAMVMQNMITKRLAEENAQDKVWGARKRPLNEFVFFQDESGPRPTPFNELYISLEEMFVIKQAAEKARIKAVITEVASKSPEDALREIISRFDSLKPISEEAVEMLERLLKEKDLVDPEKPPIENSTLEG